MRSIALEWCWKIPVACSFRLEVPAGIRRAIRLPAVPASSRAKRPLIKPGARPQVILRTIGLAAFVFDLSDKKPIHQGDNRIPMRVKTRLNPDRKGMRL